MPALPLSSIGGAVSLTCAGWPRRKVVALWAGTRMQKGDPDDACRGTAIIGRTTQDGVCKRAGLEGGQPGV